jgi:two-component system response regulator (stage 0 sporulation protein A)
MAKRKLDLNKPVMELAEEGWSLRELFEEISLCMASQKKFQAEAKREDLTTRVIQIIHEIGIPAKLKGYLYLRYIIEAAVKNRNAINGITKGLYPETANQFKTTGTRVERAIRHAIEVAWDHGDVETLQNYFGYTVSKSKGRPTNSEFIAMIVDKLYLEGYGADQ